MAEAEAETTLNVIKLPQLLIKKVPVKLFLVMVSLSKFIFMLLQLTIKNVLWFTERSAVQDIFHSVALEQDFIEASLLQFNKKKKEANQESEWKTRMKDKEDAWDSKRDAVFHHYIGSRSYTLSKCGVCEKVTNPVRCFTCKQDFCSQCDMITHCKLVLHNREVCENGEIFKFLRQSEFISEEGIYITVEGNSALLNYV